MLSQSRGGEAARRAWQCARRRSVVASHTAHRHAPTGSLVMAAMRCCTWSRRSRSSTVRASRSSSSLSSSALYLRPAADA